MFPFAWLHVDTLAQKRTLANRSKVDPDPLRRGGGPGRHCVSSRSGNNPGTASPRRTPRRPISRSAPTAGSRPLAGGRRHQPFRPLLGAKADHELGPIRGNSCSGGFSSLTVSGKASIASNRPVKSALQLLGLSRPEQHGRAVEVMIPTRGCHLAPPSRTSRHGVLGPSSPRKVEPAASGGSPGRWLVVPAYGLKVLVTQLAAIAPGRR